MSKETGEDMKENYEGGGDMRETVVSAPVALTEQEKRYYEYWLALQSCIPWLYEEDSIKDEATKRVVREFLVLYAKIKAAMRAVYPGKVNVNIGKCTDGSGADLVLRRRWYEDAKSETEFAESFFMAYLACRSRRKGKEA